MERNTSNRFFTSDESIYKVSRICKEMLLLFCAFFLPGIVGQFSGFGREVFADPLYHLRFSLQAVPQILLLLFVLGIQSPKLIVGLGVRRFRMRNLVATAFITVGLFAILTPVESLVASIRAGEGGVLGGRQWNLQHPSIIPLLALTTIVIGYREELFFRAYLLSRLSHVGASLPAAVAVSTLLFAVGHLYEGVGGVVVATITGVYFSVIFLYRRNAHELAIAHAAYNFAALLASGLS